jgi:hypothetical protein
MAQAVQHLPSKPEALSSNSYHQINKLINVIMEYKAALSDIILLQSENTMLDHIPCPSLQHFYTKELRNLYFK